MAKTYKDWGDGKKHSVSLKSHQKNVKAGRVARANDPGLFTAPRGATDVNRDANASANLRYGDQERALNTQAQQVPAFYQAYRDQVQGIKSASDASYAKGVQDTIVNAQNAGAADTTARNGLAQSMQADAATRGATVDPGLLAQDVNAQAVRRGNADNFAGLLTTLGKTQNSYLGGLQASGSAAELGQKQRVVGEQKGVATDKGNYKSGYVSDARDAERKYGLERSAFGLDVAKVQQASQDKAAQRSVTAKTQKAQRKASSRSERNSVITSGPFAGLTHGEVRHLSPADKAKRVAAAKTPKAAKPLSAEGLKTKGNIRTAVAVLRKDDVGASGYWQKSYDELVTQNGVDPVVARAMIQGARFGRLGPKTAKALKDEHGIDGLVFGKPKRRHGKSTGTGGGPHGTNRP